MPLTVIALSLYVALLILNFVVAGVSHHVTALRPIWAVIQMLNKLSSLLVLPAILIDVAMLIF